MRLVGLLSLSKKSKRFFTELTEVKETEVAP